MLCTIGQFIETFLVGGLFGAVLMAGAVVYIMKRRNK